MLGMNRHGVQDSVSEMKTHLKIQSSSYLEYFISMHWLLHSGLLRYQWGY
jgi:hypothetical protein